MLITWNSASNPRSPTIKQRPKNHRKWRIGKHLILPICSLDIHIMLVCIQKPPVWHVLKSFLNNSWLQAWWMLLFQINNIFPSHFNTNNYVSSKLFNEPENWSNQNQSWGTTSIHTFLSNDQSYNTETQKREACVGNAAFINLTR